MDAERAAIAIREDLKVPARLCGLDGAEGVAPPGYRDVDRVIAGDLQEDAGVGTALVGLSGRVQEARSEFQAGRIARRVSNGLPDRLQHLLVRRVHLHVREQREVVARVET